MGDIKEYEIKTIKDFLLIPEDRIDLCLQELKEFLKINRALNGIFKEIAINSDEKISACISLECEKFLWIDDDLGNIEVEIKQVFSKEKSQ